MPADPTPVTGATQAVAADPGWFARWWSGSDLRIYLAAVLTTAAAVTVMMRLWRVDWSAPFYYTTDSIGSAAHFKTVLATGWYESQPRLGFPYGQHYHDYPFSDDLHPAMAKLLGLFTDNWVTAFNGYYLLTFLLCAATAVWFFRVCGLSALMTVVLAVLFAVAPYHFIRNEMHLFLSGYYLIPPAMVLVLRVARGESLWGRRRVGRGFPGRILGVLTGRGAATVLILALLVWDGVYYAIFCGLLLAAAAVLALIRSGDWRRFGGAVVGGVVLGLWYVVALLPDLLYARVHGSNAGAFIRIPNEAQMYSLRFSQLVLPPPNHPFPPFAQLREWFDNEFPPAAEHPALGLIGTIGFLLLLGFGVVSIANSRRRRRAPAPGSRGDTIAQLSALTWVAFLLATVAGAGLFLSMRIIAIRGWNRMSIVIALMALAGFGLAVEAVLDRLRSRRAAGSDGADEVPRQPSSAGRERLRRALPAVAAAAVLVLGVADQSLTNAIPDPGTAKDFHSDQTFFAGLEQSLPAGAAVFQLPYRPYPESAIINGTSESDQLRPFLNTTTLRWSAGGIKGRPQTDWPATVSGQPASDMVNDLAVIGFSGILLDRAATPDGGTAWTTELTAVTGPVVSVSPNGRFAYFSLKRADQQVRLTMTPAQRAAEAARLTNGATTTTG
ncbi:hypothetical protein [Nakamurella lactea]|uniref:hypothetical protein n=1 Tax=Nakamurella lactea TaxID=459515 RepID=UPI0004280CAD|nr:hypothetical protein [Nakamurella lactea]